MTANRIFYLLVLACALLSCSLGSDFPDHDKLKGLYKGECYAEHRHLNMPGGWVTTYDTTDFEFELISFDTNWVYFNSDDINGDKLYRDLQNRGITDSLVYDGFSIAGLEQHYTFIIYPNSEKITFKERYQSPSGPDSSTRNCICLER